MFRNYYTPLNFLKIAQHIGLGIMSQSYGLVSSKYDVMVMQLGSYRMKNICDLNPVIIFVQFPFNVS